MLITRLDNENADRNLTSYVTVLTHTPDAAKHTWCQGVIKLGDGTKNLAGVAGTYLVKITVGGQTLQSSPMSVPFGTEVRSMVETVEFMVPGGDEVVIQVQSPNAADTDVDVTASLYDVGTVDVVATNGTAINGTGTPDVNVVQISGDTTAADNMESWFSDDKSYIRLVVASATDADTFVVTTAIDIPSDTFNNMQATLIRKSVSNATPERQRISDYDRINGTSGTVQLASAFTSAPAANDILIIQ